MKLEEALAKTKESIINKTYDPCVTYQIEEQGGECIYFSLDIAMKMRDIQLVADLEGITLEQASANIEERFKTEKGSKTETKNSDDAKMIYFGPHHDDHELELAGKTDSEVSKGNFTKAMMCNIL